MRAPLLLFRWLLLVLCFHTVAGVPLHETRHLREAVAATAAAAQQAMGAEAGDAEQESLGQSSEPNAEAHGLCTWCHAYASQAHALHTGALPLPLRAAPVQRARAGSVAAARTGHWRFAARDPPRGPVALPAPG